MRRPILTLAVVIVLIAGGFSLFLASRHQAGDASATPSALLGRAAPTFDAPVLGAPTFDGPAPRSINLASLRGHVVVLNFWSSWCGPCKSEAPSLSAYAWGARRQGVDVIGVLFNDNVDAATLFQQYYASLYYSVVDTSGDIANSYGVTAPPTTFVINKQGRVAAELIGPTTVAQISAVVDKVNA